jgi:hypothetical protein
MHGVRELVDSAESVLRTSDDFEGPSFFHSLRRAKRSYATGRFDLTRAERLLTSDVRPKPGDLLLARVRRLGHHNKLENPAGRRQALYLGDLVLVCYGARYATDQFEAFVPEDLAPCHLVAAGGIAASCMTEHATMRRPTEIEPLGLVGDAASRVMNLADFAEPHLSVAAQHPYVLAVVGSSMNAGKTTTAAAMIHGLAAADLRVGAAKVTGTGAGCDRWAMVDAGAACVADFTDFGYASTYQVPTTETAQVLESSVAMLGREGVDVVVVELADGLLFPETSDLIDQPQFRRLVGGLVLAASDSMSVGYGADWLLARQLPLFGLAGKLTSSPLMMREVRQVVDVPVLTLEELRSGVWTQRLERGLRVAA